MINKTFTLIAFKPGVYEREGYETEEFLHIPSLSQEELINKIAELLSEESEYVVKRWEEIYFFETPNYDEVNKITNLAKIKAEKLIKNRDEERNLQEQQTKQEQQKLTEKVEKEELIRLIEKYPTFVNKLLKQ